MISAFSQTSLKTKRTKEEIQSAFRMKTYMVWKNLMKKAKQDKATYLNLKSKSVDNLSLENKVALTELIASTKESALNYYYRAEELKSKYPFLSEMISKKK